MASAVPVSAITSFRTAFSPFNPLSRPCRLFLNLVRHPATASPNSPSHIDIQVTHLPRNSTELPWMKVGFKGGKEITLEVGKKKMKIDDVIAEVSRIGRIVEREESLKG